MAQMLSEDEARGRILAGIEALEAESVPLLATCGRFSRREILATQALPGFDNSAMDGYAVAIDGPELPAGTRLAVQGEQPAGADRGLRVGAGAAVRIFTGAPVPAGTGAIVMQEDVERMGDEIVLTDCVQPGENIRRAGSDLARGQRLIGLGEKLTPQRVGLLASQGLARADVSRAARVAILATGDELRGAGEPLRRGEIYESNSACLAALAAPLGACVTLLERARDERPDLEAKLALGLTTHDVLVIAGGVSVGERDLVKTCLAALGVELGLWRVRVQPGKPFFIRPAAGRGGSGCQRRWRARLRAAGEPGFGVRDVPVVRAARHSQADGRGRRRTGVAAVPGDRHGGAGKPRGAPPLPARGAGCGGRVHSGGPAGVVRAVWVEPQQCVGAGRSGDEDRGRGSRAGIFVEPLRPAKSRSGARCPSGL